MFQITSIEGASEQLLNGKDEGYNLKNADGGSSAVDGGSSTIWNCHHLHFSIHISKYYWRFLIENQGKPASHLERGMGTQQYQDMEIPLSSFQH